MTRLDDLLKPGANADNVRRRLEKYITRSNIPAPEDHWFWNKKGHNGDGEFFIRRSELMPNYRTRDGDGRRVSARRLIYLLYNGEIPDGSYVTSVCKTSHTCLNPDHLKLMDKEV